jgi:hypothetical protein
MRLTFINEWREELQHQPGSRLNLLNFDWSFHPDREGGIKINWHLILLGFGAILQTGRDEGVESLPSKVRAWWRNRRAKISLDLKEPVSNQTCWGGGVVYAAPAPATQFTLTTTAGNDLFAPAETTRFYVDRNGMVRETELGTITDLNEWYRRYYLAHPQEPVTQP